MKLRYTVTLFLITGTVFLLSSFFVQETVLDKVLNAMARYRQLYPQEKIFLHLDKPYYLSGETIFLKGYLLNANEGKLKKERNLIYVTLSDKQGIIQTIKVLSKGGLMQGNLDLPDSLHNGLYRLTAYTNFMRNFDEAVSYQSIIKIYNVKKPSPIHQEEKESIHISFHPEGGALVQELASKVGIRARDGSGNGKKIAGKIIGPGREEVTSFSTNEAGVGTFFLTPKKGFHYKAINAEGEWELPVSKEEGAVLQVISKPDHFKIVVSSSLPGKEELLLIAQSQGHAQFYAKGTNQDFITNIPKETLSAGLNQIVLFNKQGTVLCKRLVFVEGENRPGVQLQLSGDKFQPRQKIKASLSLAQEANNIA